MSERTVATLDPPAIVQQAPRFQRCHCPECSNLDARYPGQGYQFALFVYIVSTWRGRGSRP